MRKIILLCVLAIGMMADAQTVQTISKPLKLNIVAPGTAADSVLVRGADKIVKFVPRSKFVTIPTLQQVLTRGNITDQGIYVKQDLISNNVTFANLDYDGLSSYSYESGVINKRMDANVFGIGITSYSNGNVVRLLEDRLTFSKNDNNSLTIVPTLLGGNGILKIPHIASNTRTLPISINGNFADASGNINITNNATTTLNDALAAGNTTTLPFYNVDEIYGYTTENGVLSASVSGIPTKLVGSRWNAPDSSDFYEICLNSYAAGLGFKTLVSGSVTRENIFLLPSREDGVSQTLATLDDIKLKEYTVSTLPTGTKGDVAFVNDAASPSFLATVVGGGSAVVRVFYNGYNWIVQ